MGDSRTTTAAGSVSCLLDRGSRLGIILSIRISKLFYWSFKLTFKNHFASVNLIPQHSRIFNSIETRVRSRMTAYFHAVRQEGLQLVPGNEARATDIIRYHKERCGVMIFLETGKRIFELRFPSIVK